MPDPAWEARAESADEHMTLERSPSSHGFKVLHYKERNRFSSANIYWEITPILKTQSCTRSSACPSRPGGMVEETAETRTRDNRRCQGPWPEVSLRQALLRPEELTLSDVFREDFLQERSEEESVPGTSVTRAQAMSGAGKQNGAPQRTSTKEKVPR